MSGTSIQKSPLVARLTRRALLSLVLAIAGCAPAAGIPATGPGPVPVPASDLAGRLAAIFADPVISHAHIGVLFRSLDTGETLYELEAEKMFIPASNVKILSGAAALATLGPDYRYRTTVSLGGPVQGGVLQGPLVITGAGDPTFSDRFHPDARDVFRAWADSLKARGITRVAGGVIAVDTAFGGPSLGSGWAWDDLAAGYAAEYSALQFNENVIDVDVFPSRTTLDPAVVVLTPATQYVRVLNDTRTMPAGSVTAIRLERDAASSSILLSGEIAADSEGLTETVSVRDPALYAATVIRDPLREPALMVEAPVVRYSPTDPSTAAVGAADPVFVHLSPPLWEILAGALKPSQNLIAETMLVAAGREMRGEGTARPRSHDRRRRCKGRADARSRKRPRALRPAQVRGCLTST
jgi:D-alanyl-D-alanine carboxypeptidase/D-alanyl-D-alanine-endopeptidase (penicillin-binding protein 4)